MKLSEYAKQQQTAVATPSTAPKKLTLAEYAKQQAENPTPFTMPFVGEQKKPLGLTLGAKKPQSKQVVKNTDAMDFRAADKKNLQENASLKQSSVPGVGISFIPDTTLAQQNDKTSKTNVALSKASQNAGNMSPIRANLEPFAAGIQDFTSGIYSTLESGANALNSVVPNNPLSKGINYLYQQDQKGQQTTDIKLQQAAEGKGDAFKAYQQIGAGIGQAIPNAILAIATGGASTATQLPQIAGSAGITSAVRSSITSIAKNPMFKLSFTQNYGNAYTNAKNSGATEDEATLTALIVGLVNSGIEVTGGIETLPKALQSGNATAIKTWVTSALSEGKEEVIQGIIERLTAKQVYSPETPIVSTTDTNAVFNPLTSLKEFASGATIGGILGGGQVLTNLALGRTPTAQTQNTVLNNSSNTTDSSVTSPQAPQSILSTQGIQTPETQSNAVQRNVGGQNIKPDGLGAADAGFDQIQNLIKDYGAIEPGKGNITADRIVELPKKTSEDKNVMQTMRTIMEAPVVTNGTAEVLEKMVIDEKFSRYVNTDKMALDAAREKILDEGYTESLKKFSNAMSKGAVSKNNIALGFTLLNAAESVGDSKTSVEIITDMMDNIRDAAQTLQAVKILKKMQPEYQLYAVQRSINNFKAELEKRYGDKAPNLKIDDTLAQNYLDALFAKDEAKAKLALEDIHRNIASQVKATFADKFNAWRYTAMLFNPITHIKNIVGNFVFRGERFIKNAISASIQSIGGSGLEKTRSIVLTKKDASLIRQAQDYYAKDVDAILRYGKYDDATNRINEYRKIFNSKALEWMRKKNTEWLATEDNWVSRPAYIKALAGYLKANNVNFQTAKPLIVDSARAFAILEAQKASYRDSNAFSDFVSNARYRGKNPVGKVANALVEGELPFRRTPANILVRGLEYSPIGLAKTLTVDTGKMLISKKLPKLAKKLNVGEISTAEFIDNLSEGLTGTALTGLGMLLSALGILTVGGTGDDKTDALDKTQGKQEYAITIGNTSYSIPWLAPAAMPLFMGAAIYNKMTDDSKDGITLNDALKIATDITDPMLETSMLSGLNDFIDGFAYAKQQDQNLLWYGISQAAMDYLGQTVPTLGGKFNKIIDPTRRTVFTDSQGGIPTDLQYFAKSQFNKVPGASFANQPFIDQWGRTDKSNNLFARIGQNLLSPGFAKQINASPMEAEIQRLYDDYAKEYDINVLPPVTIKKYVTSDGEDIYMNANEYTQYKITRGQYAYKELTNLTASPEYKWMTDAEKAKAVSEIYKDAAETAKAEVLASIQKRKEGS